MYDDINISWNTKLNKSYKMLEDLQTVLETDKDKTKMKVIGSSETVKSLNEMYRIGDLGFTPEGSESSESDKDLTLYVVIILVYKNKLNYKCKIFLFIQDGYGDKRSMRSSETVVAKVQGSKSVHDEMEGEESIIWSVDFAGSVELSSIETSTLVGSAVDEHSTEDLESEVTEEQESESDEEVEDEHP